MLFLIHAQVTTFLNYLTATVNQVLCFVCFLMVMHVWGFFLNVEGIVYATYQCSMIFSIDRPEACLLNELRRLACFMKSVEIQEKS